MARVPEELRPGGAGYFEFAGALDGGCAPDVAHVREAARRLATVHLDVSRLSSLDEAGCAAFSALLRFLPINGNGVLVTGADYLVNLLRIAVEANASADACWNLLLDLYRLRGQQTEFERTALEYALAVGVSPPGWQPMVMPLMPNMGPQEKRDQPRYQPGPEMISLNGIMWGEADAQLAGLRELADERDYVNINLAGLKRLDFSCAIAFANLVNEMATAGKTVRLLRPNSLVAAFLGTLNIDAGVAFTPAGGTA
jgi:ABC-type transporter Mla MlaB component